MAVVQITFTHKQYTEQHNATEYLEWNIHNNKNTYLLTYLLTPWSRVLLEKLTSFRS
jgi:hypothetical protein